MKSVLFAVLLVLSPTLSLANETGPQSCTDVLPFMDQTNTSLQSAQNKIWVGGVAYLFGLQMVLQRLQENPTVAKEDLDSMTANLDALYNVIHNGALDTGAVIQRNLATSELLKTCLNQK